jgi:hypothetical protein
MSIYMCYEQLDASNPPSNLFRILCQMVQDLLLLSFVLVIVSQSDAYLC